jgi:multiple sugar transport system ATP-binding protein
MRAEINRLQTDLGTTTIYVTHDQVEAMTMGDRVAVMRKGELQQVAPPQELYDNPVNLFVGGFIGSPAMNMLEATIERADGGLAVVAGSQRITLGQETLSARPALERYEGRSIVLGIRPEDLDDASLVSDAPQERRLRAQVELREALGAEIMVHFSVDARPALTEDVRELAQDAGTPEATVQQSADDGRGTLMVGRFSPRSRVREGEELEVAVDTRALHFFDAETGLAVYDEADRTKGVPA